MTKRAMPASVTTDKDAKRFRKAVKAYTKDATTSKASAQKTLVDLGIYTKGGKLSSKYK